jgi:DNA-binding CsgD family transcriptional regulator
MRLASADLRWFSHLVATLHSHTNEGGLFDDLARMLHARFQPLGTVVEEAEYTMATFRLHTGIVHFRLPPDYVTGLDDSPMVARWRTLRRSETLFLSRMASRSAFHRTNYYAHICRPVGLEDQLIGTFQTAPGTALNFSVNRDKPFSEDEWTLMEYTRRHVLGCVRRLRGSVPVGPTEPALELHLESDLRPRELTAAMRRVLLRYFPQARREVGAGRLPENVDGWLRHSLLSLGAPAPMPTLRCLRTEGPGGQLVTRVFPALPGARAMTLRFTEELRIPNTLSLRSHGFTARECEVLHWLMAGKRDREIGMILGCSDRTVAKHVENLRRKTGTETRLAAAQVVRRWMCGPEKGGPPHRDST